MPEHRRAFIKGAPEIVAERAAADETLAEVALTWAEMGLRVLAVSARDVDG